MHMKKSKFQEEELDDDQENYRPKEKIRRPIKNWKRAWIDHEDDYDITEKFYK